MPHWSRLVYKRATEPWEFDQMHRLNYTTFVDEIPQHEPNEQRRLVDALLERSECFICLDDQRLVGMVIVSGQRPFSLDRKLPDLDSYLPPEQSPCEVRLLAVDQTYRVGRVFVGLMKQLLDHCKDSGYDLAVFSATARQWPMLLEAGCVEFGPRLGTSEVPFQGMYISVDKFEAGVRRMLRRSRAVSPGGER